MTDSISLPLAETAAVYLGAHGLDWLVDGDANLLRATTLALSAALLMISARWFRHRKAIARR